MVWKSPITCSRNTVQQKRREFARFTHYADTTSSHQKTSICKCQPSFFSIKNSLSAVTLQTICSSVVLFALFIQKTIMNDSTAPLSYECDRLGSNDDIFFFQQNIINIFTARFIKNSPLLWFMLTRLAKLQWVDEIPPH